MWSYMDHKLVKAATQTTHILPLGPYTLLVYIFRGRIRVYLGFPFIGFILLPFCPSIGVYIYLNTFNNKISLFHNT